MTQGATPAKAGEHVLRAFEKFAKVGMEVSYLHLEDYFKRHNYPLQNAAAGLHFAKRPDGYRLIPFTILSY